MSASRLFTLGNAIRLMILIGLVAVLVVIVQSCQKPKTGLDQFGQGSIYRLEVLEAPPAQPNISFETHSGEVLKLSDLRGQVVLLNVWATWCPPCVVEMPTLNALQDSRGNEDFQVVTVSLDRQAIEASDFFDKNDITALTPWHDGSYSLSAKIAAPGLPVSIFYDRAGHEVARVSGEADWTSPEALALINHLVER